MVGIGAARGQILDGAGDGGYWKPVDPGDVFIRQLAPAVPTYAAELEARGNGLTVVRPTPENSVSVAVSLGWSPRDRVPDAESPTWVTVEKAQV